MPQYCYDRLVQLSSRNKENGDIIADYLIAYRQETDTTDSTRATNCMNLIRFVEKVAPQPVKPLKAVTRQDISSYFNTMASRTISHYG
jgi:site-specific recombinase XerD